MSGAGAPGAPNRSRAGSGNPGGQGSGGQGSGGQGSGGQAPGGHGYEGRDAWPRDFGRDGVSGLVTLDRALRAREVSRPGADDERMATEVLAELLARVDGRRQPAVRSRS